MSKFTENRNAKLILRIAVLVVMDILLAAAAAFLALFVRYEFDLKEILASGFLDNLVRFMPVYILLVLGIFSVIGNYKSLWQFMSVEEAIRLVMASVAAALLQYFLMKLLQLPLPRSFPILNSIFLSVFTILLRSSYRLFRKVNRDITSTERRVPTMLIGGGDAGALLIRDLRTSSSARNNIVCVIDDDLSKKGFRVLEVPIVGNRHDIPAMAEKFKVQEIIMAIPSLESSQRREIFRICQSTGLPTKIIPSLTELANGTAAIQKVREVRIEDLLGRDCVHVNNDELVLQVEGKTILVTGGGGSIGSEICRQIAVRQPARLIILDIYENNAYEIQQELLHTHPELSLTVLIGSVRDKKRMEQIFRTYRPDVVYHAAAHKHVPLMEYSPAEAIKNNVFGTYNVAECADRYGTGTMVLISSDKAVNPTNVMGASKRICEMIVQMFARKTEHTTYVAVRFGNVLGSNGSVIPLFREQIAYGGPVTVTDPDIIRYFMTVTEAVSLVMQASVYGKGGEVFVLDMGNPVRIDDLARNMIRLSGLEPDVDIRIVYTGLRPGEKLYEELLLAEEGLEKTDNDLIFIGHPNGFSDEGLMESLKKLEAYSAENDAYDVVEEMKHLVTTFHHNAGRPTTE